MIFVASECKVEASFLASRPRPVRALNMSVCKVVPDEFDEGPSNLMVKVKWIYLSGKWINNLYGTGAKMEGSGVAEKDCGRG